MSIDIVNQNQSTENIIRQIATYIDRGWHVIPLKPGTKRPAFPNHTKTKCRGAESDPKCASGHVGWEERATTDMWRIEKAWSHQPYGVGIACGPSNLLVIDIDQAKADGAPSGSETIVKLQHQHRPLPETYATRTPSGGFHLYYQQPDGIRLGGTASTKLGTSVDTRGWGGQVVAAPTKIRPSRDGTRNTYWPLTPKLPAAPLPAWVVELLQASNESHRAEPCVVSAAIRPGNNHHSDYVQAAIEAELAELSRAVEGQNRNTSLNLRSYILGQLVGAGVLDRTYLEILLLQQALTIGLGETEARKTIQSGITAGQQKPRQLPTRNGGRR